MTDPDPPVKNPSRVPGILQAVDEVTSTGGRGVTITKSLINPGSAQVIETESPMEGRNEFIDDDGVYADADGNRFQFRKGHVLGPGVKKTLKKVGGYPDLGKPGEAEHEATKADDAPENKMAPKPDDKKS